MATPKRATSSTTRTKKAASPKVQETTAASPSNGNGSSVRTVNVEDLIRYRAYQLFEQRGRAHGYDKEDWLRAESEVATSSRAHSA